MNCIYFKMLYNFWNSGITIISFEKCKWRKIQNFTVYIVAVILKWFNIVSTSLKCHPILKININWCTRQEIYHYKVCLYIVQYILNIVMYKLYIHCKVGWVIFKLIWGWGLQKWQSFFKILLFLGIFCIFSQFLKHEKFAHLLAH